MLTQNTWGANGLESTRISHLVKPINSTPESKAREFTIGLNSEKKKAGPLADPAFDVGNGYSRHLIHIKTLIV